MYTQLTQEERYQIQALMKAGHNQTEIAEILGRHKSTVSRELRCNCGLCGYRPKQAHRLSVERRQSKSQPSIATTHWGRVEHLLREDWNPEQISLWLTYKFLGPYGLVMFIVINLDITLLSHYSGGWVTSVRHLPYSLQ